jgi:hypothetical protein
MGRACSAYGEKSLYRVLIGKFEEKRPLGRPGYRWHSNIKICLLEVGREVMVSIDLTLNRDRYRAFVKEVMNFRVP